MTLSEAPKARIFHVEDNLAVRATMVRLMGEYGHEVALAVGTVAQALACIPDALIESQVNVAIIDNRLPDGTGEVVVKEMREHDLGIPTISNSSDKVEWADFNSSKSDGTKQLLATIQAALQQSQQS